MLVIDSMTHLLSEIPIQCRPPVARSQLDNRVHSSSESPRCTRMHNTIAPTRQVDGSSHSVPIDSTIHDPTQHFHQLTQISSLTRNSEISADMQSNPFGSQNFPSSHYSQHSSQQRTAIVTAGVTTSFGYNPDTAANPIPLSALFSVNPGDTIGVPQTYVANTDCIAVIQSVFPIKQIEKIAKIKRDLHIVDQSSQRHTILSGYQNLIRD